MDIISVWLCLVLAVSGSFVQGGNTNYSPPEPSENLLAFLNLLSGHYSNQDQVKFESQNHLVELHENYTVSFRPVVVNGLHDKIIYYIDSTLNGKPFMRTLWAISEDKFGVIHIQILKILSSGSDKQCKPEDVDYSNIQFQPENRPQCKGVFYSVDENVFTGAVPVCTSDPKVVQKYNMMLTCHSMSLFSCYKGFVDKPRLPLIFFKDDSYALPHHIYNGDRTLPSCGH